LNSVDSANHNLPKKILLQLDGDAWCSSFDAVVAVDAGADVLLPFAGVHPDNVAALVHGAMFTRSPRKLHRTAIFVGGSDVALAEQTYQQVLKTFFGPVQVSVAMDANGCNTTSVAALQCARQGLRSRDCWPESDDDATGHSATGHSATGHSATGHLATGHSAIDSPLPTAVVLGGTGPVGQRVSRLLINAGFRVVIHSRSLSKAQHVVANLSPDKVGSPATVGQAEPVGQAVAGGQAMAPRLVASADEGPRWRESLMSASLIVNAGAAGVEMLDDPTVRALAESPGVIVDLNAVPPAGIHGVSPQDLGRAVGQRLVYGALGVGGFKMQLHRRMIAACFESNQHRFNLLEVADLARGLDTDAGA